MDRLLIGSGLPSLSVTTTGGKPLQLSELQGSCIVLYFYPRDNTPGCTQEGLDFNFYIEEFRILYTLILGVSKDSLTKHEKFKSKQGLKFELIADENGELCECFDVIKEKSLYGRKYMGIERSTFLIDEKGVLIKEWRKVKVKGHVEEVLSFIKEYKDT